jgi:hypothetical protein
VINLAGERFSRILTTQVDPECAGAGRVGPSPPFFVSITMNSFVATNAFLLKAAQQLFSALNDGAILRLYQNDFDPEPANVLSNFRECTFGGYHTFGLNGIIQAPVKVRDGLYQISMNRQTIACNANPVNTVYGAYVELFGDCIFAGRFVVPVVMSIGISLSISIQPQVSSASFLT